MTKNGQKWPKNNVFGLFKKIKSIVLPGIGIKWKFLWSLNILQRLHAWEKSGSQLMAKNASWLMRFQYFLIVNISSVDWYVFDFWNVDRHEWKEQGLLTGFMKKFLFGANGPFWAQKWCILITVDPLQVFFSKFCTVKGANRYMKVILMVFTKKTFVQGNGPFWVQK